MPRASLKMKRREAPGVCEAPWGEPCDRPTRALFRTGLRGLSRRHAPGVDSLCEGLPARLRLPALHLILRAPLQRKATDLMTWNKILQWGVSMTLASSLPGEEPGNPSLQNDEC